MDADVVVIGAGPAGLATAAALANRGIRPMLVDRADQVGANWRARYDGLRLNTVRWLSHLPGLRIPQVMGRWVGRDDFVSYLDAYAARHDLRLQPGIAVQRIDRGPSGRRRWLLDTSAGELSAAAVVVATGAFDVPVLPAWLGRARFAGSLCHASAYRSPAAYAGRSVLVVGAGASGLEIATLLADGGAGSVALSVRSCQNLFIRQWRGVPLTPVPLARRLPAPVLDGAGRVVRRLLGRDWPQPLPRAEAGLGTALRNGYEPVIADGIVPALREGRVRLVPAVADVTESGVVLVDGAVLRPDAVIAATGYRHGLAALVGHLGVLGPSALPVGRPGTATPAHPGLVFVGFEPTVTGRLVQIREQARTAARTVAEGLPNRPDGRRRG